MTKELLVRLCWRFGRAFVAGATASMLTLLTFTGNSWKDVGTWLAVLSLSGFVGGVAGVIQAIDLYLRNEK